MAGLQGNGDNPDWFYLDSTGQEFGPFTGETMREWFTQGFFPIGEELLVRLPQWKSHVPLRMVYPEVSEAFLGPPKTGQRQPRLVDDVPPQMAPPYPGYMMMPPSVPYGGPAMGYGFPGMRPGGFPSMPTGPGYGVPVLPQGPGAATGRYQGRIKSFNAKQGFGFIESPEAHAIFGRDVFLHKAQIGDLKVGTEVTYSVEMNKQGMPQARELATLDGLAPGPSKGGGGGGGGGGWGGGGGGGKGGGRGRRGKGQ